MKIKAIEILVLLIGSNTSIGESTEDKLIKNNTIKLQGFYF